LGSDAVIRAVCGDCTEPMQLEVAVGKLKQGEGVIHLGVPAHDCWDSIGFTSATVRFRGKSARRSIVSEPATCSEALR
jgi:hypothetical protein